MPHTYELLTHPTEASLVVADSDHDAGRTLLKRYQLESGKLVEDEALQLEHLLHAPYVVDTGFLGVSMPKREKGEPIVLEYFDWNLQPTERRTFARPHLGLMGFAHSQKRGLMLVDREFLRPGELGHAILLDADSFEPVGEIPLRSNLKSPIFEPDGSRLALIHTDQGGAEAQVWDIDRNADPSACKKVLELAAKQIRFDERTGFLAFLPDNELLVVSVTMWSVKAVAGVYCLETGEPRFLTELATGEGSQWLHVHLGVDQETVYEDLNMILFNSRLRYAIDQHKVYVGGVSSIHPVELQTGEAEEPIELNLNGAVTQTALCGDLLVGLDHLGGISVASSRNQL